MITSEKGRCIILIEKKSLSEHVLIIYFVNFYFVIFLLNNKKYKVTSFIDIDNKN